MHDFLNILVVEVMMVMKIPNADYFYFHTEILC